MPGHFPLESSQKPRKAVNRIAAELTIRILTLFCLCVSVESRVHPRRIHLPVQGLQRASAAVRQSIAAGVYGQRSREA
jgi:hypothetical protein